MLSTPVEKNRESTAIDAPVANTITNVDAIPVWIINGG